MSGSGQPLAYDGEHIPSLAELETALKVIARWERCIAVKGGIWLVEDLKDAINVGIEQARQELHAQNVEDWTHIKGGEERDPLESSKEEDDGE